MPLGKRLPVLLRYSARPPSLTPAAGAATTSSTLGFDWPSTRLACTRKLLTVGRKRLTMAALARRAGISYSAVIRFCRGDKRYTTLRTGLLIARALNCSPWRVQSYVEHINRLPGQVGVRIAAARIRARAAQKRALAQPPPQSTGHEPGEQP